MKKAAAHGQQNECAKISTTWVHDFSLRPEWAKKLREKPGFGCWKKIIQKPGVDCYFIRAPLFEQSCLNRSADGAKEIRRRDRG